MTFTHNLFDGFDFSNVVIIGGSVVGSALPIPTSPRPAPPSASDNPPPPSTSPLTPDKYYQKYSPFKASDVDLNIYGLDDVEFRKKLSAIFELLKKKVAPNTLHLATSNALVVFFTDYPYRHVQVSLTKFRNIWHIVTGVDIDCSALVFNGEKLWATPRARMALNRRWTVTNPDLAKIRGDPFYHTRLIKYANRGFTIVDRLLHLYEEEYTKEPPYFNEDSHYCSAQGASLLACAIRFPEIAQHLYPITTSAGLPYGPQIGCMEIISYMDYETTNSDLGNGPSESCLRVAPNECFEDYSLLHEESSFANTWYETLMPKKVPRAEEER